MKNRLSVSLLALNDFSKLDDFLDHIDADKLYIPFGRIANINSTTIIAVGLDVELEI